jgi:hypothetical protein
MKKPTMTLPCKMHLSDLSKEEKGYHCASCDKVLTDFRGKSNEETLAIIQSSPGKVCGVFDPNQFDYKVSTLHLLPSQRSVGLSLLGILGFLGPIISSCETQDVKATEIKAKAFNNLKFPMTISGNLKDEKTGQPLAFSPIEIQQGGMVILKGTTDSLGNFSITVNKNDLKQETFDLIYGSKDHISDTLKKQTLFGHSNKQKLALTLKAEAKCVKTIHYGEQSLQGDIAVEGIMVEPPLSGVPEIEIVEPEPEIMVLGEPAIMEPTKGEVNLQKPEKKRKRLFRKKNK